MKRTAEEFTVLAEHLEQVRQVERDKVLAPISTTAEKRNSVFRIAILAFMEGQCTAFALVQRAAPDAQIDAEVCHWDCIHDGVLDTTALFAQLDAVPDDKGVGEV
jgi:hypothetical protein